LPSTSISLAFKQTAAGPHSTLQHRTSNSQCWTRTDSTSGAGKQKKKENNEKKMKRIK
jgi:hypothetical protein